MNYRILKIWTAICAILFLSACTKIDSTKLGSELIPAVDNVNTFETILDVTANNYLDTLDFKLNSSNPHMVGAISEDPLFGTSNATMFFQMSPSSYPFKFDSASKFDSAVLILDYIGYYGDSLQPATFKLYGTNTVMEPDLSLFPRYDLQPDITTDHSVIWGSKTMNALQFRDTALVVRTDTTKVTRQLRIRLDSALASELIRADSNEVYANDTLYRSYLKGFALEAEGLVKTLFYFSLQGESKIQFFYREDSAKLPQDTTSLSFIVTPKSGHAVRFENNHGGSELSSHLIPDTAIGDKQIYIQSSPGTYATIKIPGLDSFRTINRVIHRAELRVVESAPRELAYSQLVAPQALYLDIIDSANNAFRGVPYDLNPIGVYYCFPGSGINFGYFGGIASLEDIGGEKLNVYRFNISRYLQGVLSKGEQLFPLFRLSAPFYMYYKECANGGASYPQQVFPFSQNNTLLVPPGFGRIKLAGGAKAGAEPAKRMQLRIIYSTL